MKLFSASRPLALVLTLAILGWEASAFPATARAASEGQSDLDKATELKLGAQTTTDLNEVVRLCESALKKGLDKTNTVFANDLMASALVQRGSVTAAKIFGDELSPAPRLNLGEDWKTYRTDALADLEKGLKLSPKQPQAYFMVAKLNLLPEGDQKKAMQSLDKAIDLADDDPEMKAKALLLRASLRKNTKQRVADLDEAVKSLPNNAMLLRARGLAFAEDQQWDKSLADFDKAIAADPTNASIYELKAAVLVKMKKFDEALPVLEKAHSMLPDNIEILAEKAQIYVGQKNFKAAVDELSKALAINGSNLGLLELRAAVYEQMGEKAKALADVEKMIELKPDDTDLLRLRAEMLTELNQFDKALEELQKLYKADPTDSKTTLQLGMLYTAMKKYDKAIAEYDEVLSTEPDNAAALRGRGDALLNVGRRGEAVSEYEKALAQEPHDPGTLNNFAWVLATAPESKLRDGHRAVTMATEACKQTDFKADYILSTLAAAYAEVGDFDSARKYAQQAVDVPASPDAEPTRKDELKKELDSYKANKPWREALPEGSDGKAGVRKASGESAAGDNSQQEKKQTDKPKKKKKKKKKPAPPSDDSDSSGK